MSLLAEPKRKQRISVDPQNLNWHNASNAFGKRMLKQMGWKGGGLGREEQGIGENVRIKAAFAQRGFGSEKCSQIDNQWISHHAEFSLILQQLNSQKTLSRCEGNNASTSAQVENPDNEKTSDVETQTEFFGNLHRKRRYNALTSAQKYSILGGCSVEEEKCEKKIKNEKEEVHEKRIKKRKRREEKNVHPMEGKSNSETEIVRQQQHFGSAQTMDAYFANKMALLAAKKSN